MALAQTIVGVGQKLQVAGERRPQSFSGDGGWALFAHVSRPNTVAADGRGGVYFTDSGNLRIRHVTAQAIITTVAGTGQGSGPSGCDDNVPALVACLAIPHGIDVAPDGSLIVTDTFHNRIDDIGKDGVLRTIAGDEQRCWRAISVCGEGGPALTASLDWPTVAHTTSRGLVIADSANRILLVHDGVIRRIAGTGHPGFSGDGGPATRARLWAPADAVPYGGGWLISDGDNCRLRYVDAHDIIHPFAGYGESLPPATVPKP